MRLYSYVFWKMILIVTLFFGYTNLFAQNFEIDSIRAELYLEQAKDSTDAENYTKSDSLALIAVGLFQKQKIWNRWTSCYYQIFDNGYYSDDFDTAIKHLNQGLETVPENVFMAKAKLHFYLGYCYDAIGQPMKALVSNETSARFFKQTTDTARLNKIYGNIGITYTKLGDNTRAINTLETAVSTGRLLDDTLTLYNNLYNLGIAYFYNNNLSEAESCYKEANRLYGIVDEDNSLLADVYLGLNRYDEALVLATKGVEKAQKKHGNESKELATAQKVVADVYAQQENWLKAQGLYQTILPVYIEKIEDQRELGKLLIHLGRTEIELGDLNAALSYFQEAISAFIPEFASADIAINPEESNLPVEPRLMDVFNGKGQCFYQKYTESKSEQDLRLATDNFELAIFCIQKVKAMYSEEASKYLLGDEVYTYFEDVIKVNLEWFRLKNDPSYKETAFRAAQLSKAFVLKEIIQEKQALELAQIPKDTIALYQQLHNELSNLTILVKDERGNRDSLMQIRLETREQQQQIKKILRQNYPKYDTLLDELLIASSSGIQQNITSNTLLLKYLEGEEHLYIFAISQTVFEIFTVPLPSNYTSIVQDYTRSISDYDYVRDSTLEAEQQFLEASFQLYQLALEKPLQFFESQNIERLMIVADGALTKLPFAALQFQKSRSWTTSDDFLISKYAVGYAYYCHSLLQNIGGSNVQNGSFVGFGVEYDDYTLEHLQKLSPDSIQNKEIKEVLRVGQISKLPFADEEVRLLSNLMNGTTWANQKATKQNFLEHAPDADILHLSAHSVVDLNTPENSALLFTKSKENTSCILRFSEIFGLDWNADLLTLSACNTGIGKGLQSEGLISLARAFHLSGIPAVVASFWSVSDQATVNFMQLFYENLKKGEAKDIALQQAQLEYLTNDEKSSPHYRKPIYWATWAAYGDQSALQLNNESKRWYYLIGFSLLVGILFLFWWRKT